MDGPSEDAGPMLSVCLVKSHTHGKRQSSYLRQPPGTRRLLFPLKDIQAWEEGALLEVCDLDRGGRIVRPQTGTEPRSA